MLAWKWFSLIWGHEGVSLPLGSARITHGNVLLTFPPFGWRAVACGWTASSSCIIVIFFGFALTPTGGKIPHYFSQYNAPCSTAAQRKSQSAMFPVPHRNLPTPESYSTITYFQMIFFYIHIRPIACAGMLEQFTAGAQAESDSSDKVAAAPQCSVGNGVKQGWASVSSGSSLRSIKCRLF